MKIWAAIKKIFFQSCAYFTIVVLALYTIGFIAEGNNMIPTISMLYMVLGFSVFISLTSNIFSAKKIPPFLKILIHFIALSGSFYLIFIFMSGIYKNSSTSLVAMTAFVVIYIIIAISVFLIKKSIEKRRLDKIDYKNQFDEKLKTKK